MSIDFDIWCVHGVLQLNTTRTGLEPTAKISSLQVETSQSGEEHVFRGLIPTAKAVISKKIYIKRLLPFDQLSEQLHGQTIIAERARAVYDRVDNLSFSDRP